MALTFNGTSSKLELVGAISPTGGPLTLFCWMKPANTSQTAVSVSSGNFGAGTECSIIQIATDLRAQSRDGGASNYAIKSGVVAAWKPAMAQFDVSGRNLWYDSGTSTTEGTVNDPAIASHNRFRVGVRGYEDNLWFTGDIAEVAAWNGTLSDADFTALAGGALPETVQPSLLLDVWPLLTAAGTQVGIINGTVLTATSTSTGASHPVTREAGGTPVNFTGAVPAQNGNVGTPYSLNLAPYFAGTETPFTYSVFAGTLPAGLSLNTSTGAISGTPTTEQTASGLVIRATDSASDTANTNSFSITVAAALVEHSYEIRANGTQTLYSQPLSLFRNGKTYAGWVATNGDVGVSCYNHSTDTASHFVISAAFEANAHDNATILFRADGRLMAVWSKHNENPGLLHYRISTSPEDISAWGAEQTVSVTNFNSYNTQLYLGLPAKHYVAYRGGGAATKVRATANYTAWDTERDWVSNSAQRPYSLFLSDGVSRVDAFFTNGHPDEVASSLYHAYLLVDAAGAETWYTTDGTLIGTGPATPGNATQIYSGTTYDGWNSDIAIGRDGRPRVLFQQYRTTGTDHRHMFSRWDGSAWTAPVEIVATGGELYAAQPWSDGQCCFDAQNSDIVYASVTEGAVKRLQEWRTDDDGKTWAFVRDLNAGAEHSAFTPSSPRGHDGRAAVVFNYGTYLNYDNINNCSLRAADSLRVEVNLTTRSGGSVANTTGLDFFVMDAATPAASAKSLARGSTGRIDADGIARLPAPGATGSAVFVVLSDTDGAAEADSHAFAAPVAVI